MFVPVVFGVATTERDVLHLEEVTTSVKLEEKRGSLHPKINTSCLSVFLVVNLLMHKVPFFYLYHPSFDFSLSYLLGEVILILQTHDQLHSL